MYIILDCAAKRSFWEIITSPSPPCTPLFTGLTPTNLRGTQSTQPMRVAISYSARHGHRLYPESDTKDYRPFLSAAVSCLSSPFLLLIALRPLHDPQPLHRMLQPSCLASKNCAIWVRAPILSAAGHPMDKRATSKPPVCSLR